MAKITTRPIRLSWYCPESYIKRNLLIRMGEFFNMWKGTPYMSGQAIPKEGVDCVNFVCAFYAFMRRRGVSLASIPFDSCFHSEDTFYGAATALMLEFGMERQATLQDGEICVIPGDLIVTSVPGKGIGHAILVGNEDKVLWHCDGNSVCSIGYELVNSGAFAFKQLYSSTEATGWR